MELKGKRVLVTGGVKGIGRSIVDKLLLHGAVVGVVDCDRDGLCAMGDCLPDVLCLQCDVTDFDQVKATVDSFVEAKGGIDVLVNNAGVLFSAPLLGFAAGKLEKHDPAMWDRIIQTNLSSLFYVTVNVAEKMAMRRTKGVIVNISSVSASGNAGQSAYSAAKAGVNALTATWAKELSAWGIRVAAVAPGYTDTDSTRAVLKENVLDDIVKKVPLRRLGKPDEISEGILWVIRNDFFNGKILELDGGLVI